MEISSKAALVSGGASGLGLATVRGLVAGGAHVVVMDLPSSNGAALADELGPTATFAPTDVRDEDQVQRAVDRASEAGELAMVVNCAGVGEAVRVVGKGGVHSLEVFRRTLEINLLGTFNVIRLAAARMIETQTTEPERGVIVNTASVAAYDGQVGQAAYSASKGGIVGMTLPIARDLAQHRIRVVTVAPGLFMTPLFESLPEAAIASLGAQTPHPQRLGDPDEFALMVTQIIANPMLNGETIRLDGAIRMAPR
ncbi:MAG: SDR family NAD(P)-dependent oxidoreductase [Nocardioides sp.]